MYKNVLITGAGGFIGSHLVKKQLSLGRNVRALDIQLSRLDGISDSRLERVPGDFTDSVVQREATQGVDVVFHLASAHLEVKAPEKLYWQVNVNSLPGLLESCREAGVQRFLHISSIGVYGEVQRPPANEDSPCNPELLYERTKYEGEKVVKTFYEKTGFPIVILRPAWVYGPGCPRTDKLFRTIKKGRFFFVGKPGTLRHCVYIDDFVDAMELAANAEGVSGKTYIIGDNEAVTIENLVEQIARVSSVATPRRRIPLWLLNALSLALEAAFLPLGKEPPVSRRTLRFFTGNTAFDISRARNELAFLPEHDVASGMELYARWLDTAAQSRERLPVG